VISLRRSIAFFPPKAVFLFLEASRRASKRSRSKPLPVTGASGLRGESPPDLDKGGRNGFMIGGVRWTGLKPSSSEETQLRAAEKGDRGSTGGAS
jgi:hypothetical protein